MSDDIKDRFSRFRRTEGSEGQSGTARKGSAKKPDLFSIWDDQRNIEAEDKKIAKELENTKRKAKELKKTLRKNKYGELKTDTKDKLKRLSSKSNRLITTHRKFSIVSLSVVMLIVIGVFANSVFKKDPTETLGESTSNLTMGEDLPRETPQFKVLYPSGKSAENYDTVRISPDGAEPSYTYLDRFTDDGQIFKVTQQKVPDNFDLNKVATEFQATSIIQIDENKVYHGYSEKGGVQSLIFVKEDNLISIRSPQKFTDDQWAGYIISLK